MKKLILLIVISLIFSSSCSKMLMPYAEEKLCNKGVAYGYCGRISEIYEDTLKHPWKYQIEEVQK